MSIEPLEDWQLCSIHWLCLTGVREHLLAVPLASLERIQTGREHLVNMCTQSHCGRDSPSTLLASRHCHHRRLPKQGTTFSGRCATLDHCKVSVCITSTVLSLTSCSLILPITISAVSAHSAVVKSRFVGMGGNFSAHLLSLPSLVKLKS